MKAGEGIYFRKGKYLEFYMVQSLKYDGYRIWQQIN
jgi:hypothetical protein